MVVKEFSALNFRNYREILVQFSDRINLLHGNNGQGKTNLVEGIYFLHHLDSFRTHKLGDLTTFGESTSYLQGMVVNAGNSFKAKIELSRGGRRVWLNEEPVKKHSLYVSTFYALLFNPDSLYAYRHYPSERRAFYDRFLSFYSIEYLNNLKQFKEAHTQKNSLLKRGDFSALPEWNYLFVNTGCAIIKERRKLIENLNGLFPEIYFQLTGLQPKLQLQYLPSLTGEQGKDLELLDKSRDKEARAGHAQHGPHRDEFRMVLAGEETAEESQVNNPPREENYFSQGEYRISLLCLKLSLNELLKTQRNYRPVVILDDLFSELDDSITNQLSGYLNQIDNQVFVTTTEPPGKIGLTEARIMEIRQGSIES